MGLIERQKGHRLITSGQIYSVTNIGKLQVILRGYDRCDCIHHIDRFFFETFHDVTRWKLIVFTICDKERRSKKDGILLKYIPYNENKGIIAKIISITLSDMKYPKKHIDNRKDLHPPSLFQQSLLTIFKCKDTVPFIVE